MELGLYELPEGWRWSDLNFACSLITDGAHASPKTIETGKPYITVRDIDDAGNIDLVGCKKISDEDFENLIKGKCSPVEGSVLFSKDGTVGKVALVKGYEPFVVLSSLAILEPKKELLLPEYLKWFMLSPALQENAIGKKTGAAIKRVVLRTIKSLEIPLPSMVEQKRIVTKLDALFTRIDAAIAHLQETLELSKTLFASALDEEFSPQKPKWDLVPLSQVATVARGKSKHRPRNDKTLFGGNYPFIQTGDIRNAHKYVTSYSSTYNEKGLAQSRLWPKGTICLTIAANIGEVALLGMDACFPDSVVGISTESELNEYVYYFLTTLQQHLDSKANAAAQKNINLRVLSEIEIPIPPIQEQQRIVKLLNSLSQRTGALEDAIEEKLNHLSALKASLLDAAFRGQL